MSQLKIKWVWKLKGQFHIGTGIGRVGYADSILRKDGEGNFFIPGDAVKGAVRESAERLMHWLLPDREKNEPSTSFPDLPLLKSVFAPQPEKTFYRFYPGRPFGAIPSIMCPASTAIKNANGVADDATLRITETLAPDVTFHVSLTGENGTWNTENISDKMTVLFLLASILVTESIGGKKGVGHGEVTVGSLSCEVDGMDILHQLLPSNKWQPDLIDEMKNFVKTSREGVQI